MKAMAICVLLAACAPLEEPPVAADAGGCDAGATRACAACSVGALRTNLPGVETCQARDGGPAWGPCRCAAEGGAP